MKEANTQNSIELSVKKTPKGFQKWNPYRFDPGKSGNPEGGPSGSVFGAEAAAKCYEVKQLLAR